MEISNKDLRLRNNQKEAVKVPISNDFSSGIHFHATGTGKSWTAMLILKALTVF